MCRDNKDRAVNAMRARFFAAYRGPNHLQACPHWAQTVVTFLKSKGRPAVLQAGTALFRRVPRETFDAQLETHYGYCWNERSQDTTLAIIQNRMPEVHVWAADLQAKTVIDLTLGFQRHLCQAAGIDWLCEEPPPYLWARSCDIDR